MSKGMRWTRVFSLALAVAGFSFGCSASDDSQPQDDSMLPVSAGTGGASAGAGAAPAGMGARAGAAAGSGAAGDGSANAGSSGQAPPMGGAGGMAGDGAAGAMAAGDAGMLPDSDAGMAGDPPAREDLGEGDGSDVIAIGDSWMSLGSTGIQQSLVAASGQPYRTYGVGGTRLLGGECSGSRLDAIPCQYARAKEENADIKTVVMTGGGNDIIQEPGLREDCAAGGMRCDEVVGGVLDRLTELWEEMAADGVQDVIYVQYSNPEGNNVDFALSDGDSAPARCEMVPPSLRCHQLPTLDIVMGDIPDGIHPSAVAYDRIGEAVYEMMVERGMRR